MLAAIAHEFGKPLSLDDVPCPEPGSGQVLVKVHASGVCHTDVHAVDGDWPVKPKLPFTPGHEGAGEVVALGPGVTGVAEGDRVGVPWLHSACGVCEYCITGWETLCPWQQNTGYSVNGCFAEFVLAPAAFASPLPDGLSYDDAGPILCAGVTTYKGLKETDTKPGDWVAISGVGGLGHLGVQYAKAMGRRVVAIDVTQEKLDLATRLGADLAVNAKDDDAVEQIQDQTGGCHGALVTAVSTPAFHQAIGTLRRGGTCSLVGLPPGEFPTPIFEVVLKRLTVRGSIVGTRQDMAEALQFAADGKVKPIFEKRPMDKVNETIDQLRRSEIQGRVVLAVSS
jgi:propanol-preferring alcohol dehydrogenase